MKKEYYDAESDSYYCEEESDKKSPISSEDEPIKQKPSAISKGVKTIFLLLAFFVLIQAGGSIIGKLIGTSVNEAINNTVQKDTLTFEEKKTALMGALEKAAEQINNTAPMMVDDLTRIDKATTGPDFNLNYHYTMLDSGSMVVNKSTITEHATPNLIDYACTNEYMQIALTHGANITHTYSREDGTNIVTLSVNKSDCPDGSIPKAERISVTR